MSKNTGSSTKKLSRLKPDELAVERIMHGIVGHRDVTGYDASDLGTSVRDMLSDLRHFCDVYAIDFAAEDEIAHRNYLAELQEMKTKGGQ